MINLEATSAALGTAESGILVPIIKGVYTRAELIAGRKFANKWYDESNAETEDRTIIEEFFADPIIISSTPFSDLVVKITDNEGVETTLESTEYTVIGDRVTGIDDYSFVMVRLEYKLSAESPDIDMIVSDAVKRVYRRRGKEGTKTQSTGDGSQTTWEESIFTPEETKILAAYNTTI